MSKETIVKCDSCGGVIKSKPEAEMDVVTRNHAGVGVIAARFDLCGKCLSDGFVVHRVGTNFTVRPRIEIK